MRLEEFVEETVPCKYCGEPTPMTGTKMCHNCWEVVRRIRLFAESANEEGVKLIRDILPPCDHGEDKNFAAIQTMVGDWYVCECGVLYDLHDADNFSEITKVVTYRGLPDLIKSEQNEAARRALNEASLEITRLLGRYE